MSLQITSSSMQTKQNHLAFELVNCKPFLIFQMFYELSSLLQIYFNVIHNCQFQAKFVISVCVWSCC